MKLFKNIAARFTRRGRALALNHQGMTFANSAQPDLAIKHYNDVINSSKSPRDVKAMALFNRALVYTAVGNAPQAKVDLNAILNMPEAMTKIKKSASDKLVRMQRKQKREDATKNEE